ncbi:Trk family potassium uptake protein [Clostridiales bacterium COT073_COT-073]|nr:Trk family potassium uptake protein [Clostridiales bacterium COT073_COT-073]
MKELIHKLKPTQVLILGFAFLVFLGAVLLDLPMASQNGKSVGFINALFTSTSAVCVTGLVVVNTLNQWTMFGKIIIIILIQIGGLGFMTLTAILFILMGKKIGLRERLIIQESLNQSGIAGLVRLTKKICVGTLIVEGLGALLLTIFFIPIYGWGKGAAYGVFHAISAFCNAGFDIIGENSLAPFVKHWPINLVLILLIVGGGLGFGVWFDMIQTTKEWFQRKQSNRSWFRRLELHSKLVLTITAILLAIGFVFFYLLERKNPATMMYMTTFQRFWAALFQSVTLRTAGFFTVDFSDMTQGSQFVSILLMFIGGSPAGTAGGIKTVTVGVLILQVLTTIRGKQEVEIFERHIPERVIKRALSVIMIGLAVVMAVSLVLTVTEDADFMKIAFETVSAFGTAGVSLGFTSSLSVWGKLIISVTMFIGRLGPVTIAFAMAMRGDKVGKIKTPEGKIMVG